MVKIKMGKNEVPISQSHFTTLKRNVEYATHDFLESMTGMHIFICDSCYKVGRPSEACEQV